MLDEKHINQIYNRIPPVCKKQCETRYLLKELLTILGICNVILTVTGRSFDYKGRKHKYCSV
jgi:hypothetical protein